MPLEVARLLSSDMAATVAPEACWAAVLLWCAAWHQVPAASIPNDDRVLARLAGHGRNQRSWMRIRNGALQGWRHCSDGRLYHPVVAEKALEAWMERLKARLTSGAGNASRWGAAFDREPVDRALAVAAEMLACLNPQSRGLRRARRRDTALEAVTDSQLPTGSRRDRNGQGQLNRERERERRHRWIQELTGQSQTALETDPPKWDIEI